MTAGEKSRGRMLILLGLCLHLAAVGLLVAWIMGAFSDDTKSDTPSPTPTQKKGNQIIQKNNPRPNG